MQSLFTEFLISFAKDDYALNYKLPHSASNLSDRRKLFQYLFAQPKKQQIERYAYNKLNQEKVQQIQIQYKKVSEAVHSNLNIKNTELDKLITRMQTQWRRFKIPYFYCYFFLKFCSANNIQKIQEIVSEELLNLSKENYLYKTIIKAIDARQSCLDNLMKQGYALKKNKIEQDLQIIQEQMNIRAKTRLKKEMNDHNYKALHQQDLEIGTDRWKNKIELFFDSLFHFRKLTIYIVEMINKWKNHIMALTSDPKNYKQRIVFYYNNQNYLLKLLVDIRFLSDCPIKQYIEFTKILDPFILNPFIILEQKKKSPIDLIFYKLLKPKQTDLTKIIKSLEILAEQKYIEDNYFKLYPQKQADMLEKNNTVNNLFSSNQKKFQSNMLAAQNYNSIKKSQSSLGMRNKRDFKELQANQQRLQAIQQNKYIDRRGLDVGDFQSGLQKKVNQIASVELKRQKHQVKGSKHKKDKQEIIKRQFQNKNSRNLLKIQTTSTNNIFNNKIKQNLKKLEDTSSNNTPIKNKIIAGIKLKQSSGNIFDSLKQERLNLAHTERIQMIRNSLFEPNYQTLQQPKSNSKQKDFITTNILKVATNLKNYNSNKIESNNKNEKSYSIRKKSLPKRNQRIQKQLKQQLQVSKIRQSRLINQLAATRKQAEVEKTEVIILKQQPEKIEEIKKFLYTKIKQQVMAQMMKNAQEYQQNIKDLIEEEKRKRVSQLMQKQRQQQQKRLDQLRIKELQEIQRIRNIIIPDITIEQIQYTQETAIKTVKESLKSPIFNALFNTNEQKFTDSLLLNFYNIILKIKIKQFQIGFVFLIFDDSDLFRRKIRINYITTQQNYYFISIIDHVLNYIWQHDPAEIVQITLFENPSQTLVKRMISDLVSYTETNAKFFSKQLIINPIEKLFVFFRNQNNFSDNKFQGKKNLYSRSLNIKVQILSTNQTLFQAHPIVPDGNLQYSTDYIFLIQELFRNYLTPQQLILLRENTQNLRRLKDIFQIMQKFDKNKLTFPEFKVIEGLNIEDLSTKIRQRLTKPHQKYYWTYFHDMKKTNRLLLSILEYRLEFDFLIDSAKIQGKNYFRLQTNQQIILLKSSIYPQDLIYVIPTKYEKIKIILVRAKHYKLMRIQLLMFINLLFKNMVSDQKRHIDNIWIPQFMINSKDENTDNYCKKEIKKISDFSITMKKNMWLGQEIYFCNKQYIKNAIQIIPKQKDEIFSDSFIFGLIHSDIEKQAPGFPVYAKLIENHNYLI